MENKSFDLIVKRVGAELENNGFKKRISKPTNEKDMEAIFTGKSGSIKISFDHVKKRIELSVSSDLDVHAGMPWSVNSSWLFDPEFDGDKEAISIANDFIELVNEGARKKISSSKKRKKDEDSNFDSHFFINRFVNLFPNIKSDVEYERKEYESFRYVTFIKEKVVPEIKLLINGLDNVKIRRFCKFLSEAYENGDKDVRSIVTIVILNSMESEKTKIEPLLSEELNKAWIAAEKYKYKKVKPEKPKKKSLMSKMMDSVQPQ